MDLRVRVAVETPERVRLHHEVAGIGSRFAAVLDDGLILGMLVLGLVVGFWAATEAIPFGTFVSTALQGVVLVAIFLLVWGYHFYFEAFRGEWDFREATEGDFDEAIDDPRRDISLWKVAWSGDVVVGQVKPYIDAEENAASGIRRGWTEYISTHREWRNRGIAGALLAMSLRELRDRGMTEAALGVDVNNQGGAFHLYTRLGFALQRYEAVYTRPARAAL